MGTGEPIPYGQRDGGALELSNFRLLSLLEIYAQRASSIPSGCLPEKRGTGGPLRTSYDENLAPRP